MVLVSYSGREINAKLVYYGPGLSGKTTNLEYIYGSIPQTQRGKMVSMKTKTERTLFFDFLPVDLGELSGFKTRFLLYTVPGQVYYNATRKLVLKGVDAMVFVADSKRGKMDENVESLANLRENLRENGLDLDQVPWVIQYNKRDLPDVYTVAELEQVLNPGHVPAYEGVATTGQGVVGTFKAVSRLLLRKLAKEIGVPVVTAPQETASAPVETLTPMSPPMSVAAFLPMRVAAPAPEPEPVAAFAPEPEPELVAAPAPEPEPEPVAAFAPEPEPEPVAAFAPEPEPVAAPAPEPVASEQEAHGLSVGERLRRWLSRPSEAGGEEAPSFTTVSADPPVPEHEAEPEEVMVPDLTTPEATAPEVTVPDLTAPEAMFPPAAVLREEPAHPPGVLSLPPRRPAHGAGRKPREIIVPLSLEPRDLEMGVVLRLAFQMPSQDEDEEETELGEAA